MKRRYEFVLTHQQRGRGIEKEVKLKKEGMRPLFCRVGNKYRSAKTIISHFPKEYRTYVEPFIGSGAVLFRKEKKGKEVINDLDNDLIQAYRLIDKTNFTSLEKYERLKAGVGSRTRRDHPNDVETLRRLRAFYAKKPVGANDKLYHAILTFCNTFSGLGQGKLYIPENQITKLKKMDLYKERMKGVKILNEDYKKVIRDYDAAGTLFYLDPPYEDSKAIYKEGRGFDHEELARVLSGIKGKFALSLNNSPNIRRLFSKFRIIPIKEIGNRRIGDTDVGNRSDVLIMNY